MPVEFDVIPYQDIKGKWKKLGSGSFGNVYKATYLGIDVAIKEVLPSDEYDVSKYFDREWRLMREARHPNVVLYIALSRAPSPDDRIFIISEFIENGNLREYIYHKNKPLPWRLRLSFATDIVRAMSYLHARQCIHRDLKPENLLITANGRVKVTDFGFARIVAQTAEETRRLTFCGTDSYMSPEIQMGEAFGLETDVYSLGIIFCELAARKLADDDTFKRTAPDYSLDRMEVKLLADPDTPPAFLSLALACCSTDRFQRPTMFEVLNTLRDIEKDVVQRSLSKAEPHIGSVKFLGTKGKKLNGNAQGVSPARPGNRRIPSFGMGVHVGKAAQTPELDSSDHSGLRPPGATGPLRSPHRRGESGDPSEDEEDEELEAILALNGVNIREELTISPTNTNDMEDSWRLNDWTQEHINNVVPNASQSQFTVQQERTETLDSSTESLLARVPLLRNGTNGEEYDEPSPSSTMTVRPVTHAVAKDGIAEDSVKPHHRREPNTNALPSTTMTEVEASPPATSEPVAESYFTAHMQSTFAQHLHPPHENDAETSPSSPAIPAAAQPIKITTPLKPPEPISATQRTAHPQTPPSQRPNWPAASATLGLPQRVHRFSLMKGGPWSPLEMIFGSALGTGAKCDLCFKRLGWKPCLECDDCSLTVHMKCGETAPMDCEVRETQKVTKPSRVPLCMTPQKRSPPKSKSPKQHK